MTSDSNGPATSASGHARATTLPPESIQGTGRTSRSMAMPEQSTLDACLGLTSSPPASPASLSHLLELKGECPAPTARSLLRRCGWPAPEKCLMYFLRTSSGCFTTTEVGPSGKSYPQWMSAGMMRNGSVLTGTVSFPKTATECSLLDVLEDHPQDRYFRSPKARKAMKEHAARHAAKGNGFAITTMRGRSLQVTGSGDPR